MHSRRPVLRRAQRVQGALDEGRILILGTQILLGSLYRSAFEPGFDNFPVLFQYLVTAALALIVAAFIVLILPVAYRWVTARGADRPEYMDFMMNVMKVALPLLGASMALTLYAAASKIADHPGGILLGTAGATGGLLWLLGIRRKGKRPREQEHEAQNSGGSGETLLNDRIRHVLTEARMVLPGAQALLGFQFITMMLSDFDRLPESSKLIHLAGLLLTAISVALLMTPAAYHRIVERGANTEAFDSFAGRILLAAMIPLALGIAADFFVVVRKVSGSLALAAGGGAVVLLLSFGLWFGYTAYLRSR